MLETLSTVGHALVSAMDEMFGRAMQRGEIHSDTDYFEMLVALLGAPMGVCLLSYGMAGTPMGPAAEILVSAFEGHYFS